MFGKQTRIDLLMTLCCRFNVVMRTQHKPNSQTAARIHNFVGNEPRRPGSHYKLASSGTSLAIEIPGEPYIDRAAMSARAVISTATVDRVGDSLVPRGCRLDNYVKNPVVMWAHGLAGISQPIGTSRDARGNVAVTISDRDVHATSWFSQKSLEAAQIFELIDEGIIRATSVRERPIKSRVVRDPEAGDVLVVEEWELEEWSWCAIGVNPDAVAKALHRNKLAGRPMTPSILKSLIAVAPTAKRFGLGLPMEKTVTDPDLPHDDDLVSMAGDTAVESNSDDWDAEAPPYGSTVVSAVHASLATACHNIADAMGPLENPMVKEGLQAILSALQGQMIAIEGLHTSCYPDQTSLKASDDDSEQAGEAMKAFLASGRLAPLQVLGLGARLQGLVAARNLTPDQRRTLGGVSQQLARLVAQSKAHHADGDADKIAALQQSISDLTGLVGAMKK
jgi:hypothetical protein